MKLNKKVPFLYKIAKFILGPIFRFYYSPKIIGKENIPKKGNIVIASNHIHLMDQCLTIISTKRGIHYMAKKEYFDSKKTAWFFKGTGCISVDREHGDEIAKEKALEVLKDGGALGIFPEGTRNKTKKFILPFKYGAVSLANKTNSLVVPIGVTGTYKFRSKDLIARIGAPIKMTGDIEKDNKKLYNVIKSLMEENLKK